MYKYTLEPVLNHRKIMEENLQKELGACKNMLAEEKRRLGRFVKSRHTLLRELKQKQEQGITGSEVILYLSFIEELTKDMEQQREKVAEIGNRVDRKREELVEVMKKRKTLERLKEKAWHAYQKEILKSEQDMMNELAIRGFNRAL